MKEIKLSPSKHGQFYAQVDDADYDFLMQWKWYVSKGNKTFYARASYWDFETNVARKYDMHRLLLGLTQKELEGEHKDHNGLNNQRTNLRIATKSQNQMNRTKNKNSTSKFRGVCLFKVTKYTYWVAKIKVNEKHLHLGYFKNEEEAARAYDEAAIKYFKEFANLNFKV